EMDRNVLVGLEDAAVHQGELGDDADLFKGRPLLPGQDEDVAGGQKAAAPGTADLVRTEVPGAERRFEALGADLQRLDVDRAGGLDGVAVAVTRLQDDLQGLVAGLMVVVVAAGAAAERDLLER